MASTARRLFVPLDAAFFDDERVVEVGEKPAWLLLAVYCRIKQLGTDGTITRAQVARLGVPGWQTRMRRLVEFGLVEHPTPDVYQVPSWLKWNESQADRESRRLAAQDRARKRWGSQPPAQSEEVTA